MTLPAHPVPYKVGRVRPRQRRAGAPPRRRASAPPPYVSALLVQEYASLRSESLSAKQNQQTILQWTLATVGIVIAAGIAAAAGLKDLDAVGRFGLNLATTVLVGALVPVVVSCAFGIWMGELFRMERAGQFLRDREVAWSGGAARSADPRDPQYGLMLLWENLLADATRARDYPKNLLGGAASVGLFVSLSFFSLTTGVAVAIGPGGMLTDLPTGLEPTVVVWVTGVWVALFLATNLAVFARPLYMLVKGEVGRTVEELRSDA